MDNPKLRYVDVNVIETGRESRYLLVDPLDLSNGNSMVAPPAVVAVMSLLDGTRDIPAVQNDFLLQNRILIESEAIRRVVQSLDAAYLLENERFQQRLQAVKDEYREQETRPAALAGTSYPEDPTELRAQLDAFNAAPGGADSAPRPEAPGPLVGVVAPHIDYQRGGACYTHVYREIADSDAEVFVILGLDHKGLDGPFSATRKDFITPLGRARTDARFLDALEKLVEQDLYAGELGHRAEHSIELQVVFLQHVMKDRPFTIVPILCSGFHDFVLEGRSPLSDPRVTEFVEALSRTLREDGRRALVIIGADLAHMGRNFGGTQDINEEFLSDLRIKDMALLEHVENADAESFMRALSADKNARSVCSSSNLSTGLAASGCERGTLMAYEQAVDTENPSVVSFAGVCLYRTAGGEDSRGRFFGDRVGDHQGISNEKPK